MFLFLFCLVLFLFLGFCFFVFHKFAQEAYSNVATAIKLPVNCFFTSIAPQNIKMSFRAHSLYRGLVLSNLHFLMVLFPITIKFRNHSNIFLYSIQFAEISACFY